MKENALAMAIQKITSKTYWMDVKVVRRRDRVFNALYLFAFAFALGLVIGSEF